jgi:hypothetical protein
MEIRFCLIKVRFEKNISLGFNLSFEILYWYFCAGCGAVLTMVALGSMLRLVILGSMLRVVILGSMLRVVILAGMIECVWFASVECAQKGTGFQ